MSDERAQSGATHSQAKTVSQVFGEIVWLLSQCVQWRELRISDLERLIMPAIVLKQFQIEYVQETPVTVTVWSRSIEENIKEKIFESQSADVRLWSGNGDAQPILTASVLNNPRRI